MAGGSLYKLRDLLGHSTIQMTEIYAHLAPGAWAEDCGRVRISAPRRLQSIDGEQPGNNESRGAENGQLRVVLTRS